MSRIFLTLIVTTFLLLCSVFVMGMSLGDVHDPAAVATQKWKQIHFMAGVFTCVFVMLVQSIVVTWFIGTSRWCKEVVEAYSLPAELANQSARLKRRSFPVAVITMLSVVGVAALGACSDPAAALQVQPLGGLAWHNLHFLAAVSVMVWIGFAFYLQWQRIEENSLVISQIMDQVRKIRLDRGLDADEPVSESQSVSVN